MMATLRGLRAIMWLRWRLLKNSMIGGRKRDEVEQLSRAFAMIVPFMIIALSAGTFISVCAVGYVGGRMMASGLVSPNAGLLVVRLLAGLMVFTIIALSLVSPTQSAMSRYTRLILLPIPRRVLHLVEVLASCADPWVAVVTAGLSTLAIGLYVGGRADVAVAALLAAILTVATVVCAGALVGFAKSKLSAGDFGEVSKAVPGMDSLLKMAPALGGNIGSSLGGLASLAGSFQKLGLSPDMVMKAAPLITGFLNGKGAGGAAKAVKTLLRVTGSASATLHQA